MSKTFVIDDSKESSKVFHIKDDQHEQVIHLKNNDVTNETHTVVAHDNLSNTGTSNNYNFVPVGQTSLCLSFVLLIAVVSKKSNQLIGIVR